MVIQNGFYAKGRTTGEVRICFSLLIFRYRQTARIAKSDAGFTVILTLLLVKNSLNILWFFLKMSVKLKYFILKYLQYNG